MTAPSQRSTELCVLAQRIADALPATVLDAVLTGSVSSGAPADTVALAPDGPNVVRARAWLAEGAELLRERVQGDA